MTERLHPSLVDTQRLPQFRRPETTEDSDSEISIPAVRMGDEQPPPCPDWFAWWLKNEYRPAQKAIAKQLKTRQLVNGAVKPILYSGATLLATEFPRIKSFVEALLGAQ